MKKIPLKEVEAHLEPLGLELYHRSTDGLYLIRTIDGRHDGTIFIKDLGIDIIKQKDKQIEELTELLELAKSDLGNALTEKHPYDEICNDLYEIFKGKLKQIKEE